MWQTFLRYGMKRLEINPLTPIHALFTAPPIDKETKEAIEAIWETGKKRWGDSLFNGKLFSVLSIEQERITGYFAEYKWFYAVKEDPSLQEKLNIVPLSISGITVKGRSVLIGKRSFSVTESPGMYECPPSGGIDMRAFKEGLIDVERQFLIELDEEIGVAKGRVKRQGLVYDDLRNAYEYTALIEIDEAPLVSNTEYDSLFWLPFEDIGFFTTAEHPRFVPLSLLLLDELG